MAPGVASALILAAAALVVVPGTAVATRRLDARRRRDDLMAAAIADVFTALAQSALGDQQGALELFARAKAQLVIYAPPETVDAVLLFERSGSRASDPEAQAAIVRLSEAARATSGAAAPVPREHVPALLFGPGELHSEGR